MSGPTPAQRNADSPEPPQPHYSTRLLTIPNILCIIRLVGAFVLVAIAWMGQPKLFFWGFVVLAMTDWLDGKLAILLDQRSVFGARLDSWADATLYAGLLVGTILLHGAILRAELAWIIPPLATYLISTAAGFWKYRRWPSYHTRAAKTCWLLMIVGVYGMSFDLSLLPLRIALVAVTLTNIEALFITIISPSWRADVTSIYHAWRDIKNS